MAMYRNTLLVELENEYSKEQNYSIDGHVFTLKLERINPLPTTILDYDWLVTLPNQDQFYVNMGSINISFPPTRLEHIINRLEQLGLPTDSFLPNAINDTIDNIFRQYSKN